MEFLTSPQGSPLPSGLDLGELPDRGGCCPLPTLSGTVRPGRQGLTPRLLCSISLLQTDTEWDHFLDLGSRFHPISHPIPLGVDFTSWFCSHGSGFTGLSSLFSEGPFLLGTLTSRAGLGKSRDRFLPQVAHGLWFIRQCWDSVFSYSAPPQSAVRL